MFLIIIIVSFPLSHIVEWLTLIWEHKPPSPFRKFVVYSLFYIFHSFFGCCVVLLLTSLFFFGFSEYFLPIVNPYKWYFICISSLFIILYAVIDRNFHPAVILNYFRWHTRELPLILSLSPIFSYGLTILSSYIPPYLIILFPLSYLIVPIYILQGWFLMLILWKLSSAQSPKSK